MRASARNPTRLGEARFPSPHADDVRAPRSRTAISNFRLKQLVFYWRSWAVSC